MRNKLIRLISLAVIIASGCKEKPPKIVFMYQTVNMGVLDSTHKITTKTFRFKNRGGHKLVIKNIASDCSCTVAKFTKDSLSQGQEGEILITVNRDQIIERGNLERRAVVESNTTPILHSLIIKMRVN
ncbi:DUF1573 domain-containing protein [Mucilaginibacter ginkgonis]|uniref:DUF1573 domain-containing protein n=1 Tax=Mucilaginibacter ginkgonis TaxID=2682091 RepID=A0A6I4I1P4_9SPHI|nr:DUF1573 domain-containing protein [Mucilaginibacter ginkgonis]QQL51408.1 DUF1573 domain-containing protein [Mucilaginibacter ginkgonis]